MKIERKGIRYFFIQKITRIIDNVVCAEAIIEVACMINGKVVQPEMFDKAFADYITWKN